MSENASITPICPKCSRADCISYAANIAHDLAQQVDPSAVMFVRENERAAIYSLCDLVDAVEDRPADFWTRLTPAQALALIKAAPDKIAGPWQDEPEAAYPSAMARRTADGRCVADVFRESKTARPNYITAEGHGECDSLEEGRAIADALLRKAGWVLVDG